MRYSVKPLNRFNNYSKAIIEATTPTLALKKYLKNNDIKVDTIKRITKKVENTIKSKSLEVSNVIDFIVRKESGYINGDGGRYILKGWSDNR